MSPHLNAASPPMPSAQSTPRPQFTGLSAHTAQRVQRKEHLVHPTLYQCVTVSVCHWPVTHRHSRCSAISLVSAAAPRFHWSLCHHAVYGCKRRECNVGAEFGGGCAAGVPVVLRMVSSWCSRMGLRKLMASRKSCTGTPQQTQ